MATQLKSLDHWTGRWKWNAATHTFDESMSTAANGSVWQEQIQTIEVRGRLMTMRNNLVFLDGTRREWLYEGALDGNPYPIHWTDDGSVMTTIAFMQIDTLRGADSYFAPDGSFAGSEYFTVEGDHVKVWGAMTVGGQQSTYFEEWNRI